MRVAKAVSSDGRCGSDFDRDVVAAEHRESFFVGDVVADENHGAGIDGLTKSVHGGALAGVTGEELEHVAAGFA